MIDVTQRLIQSSGDVADSTFSKGADRETVNAENIGKDMSIADLTYQTPSLTELARNSLYQYRIDACVSKAHRNKEVSI